MANYGFKDLRTPAELMLGPARPLARGIMNPSSLGGISAITGPIRGAFSGILELKKLTSSLTTALSTTLSTFEANRASLMNGSLVPNPTVTVGGVPGGEAMFAFSGLKPGQPVPASFRVMINQRKEQLQALTARMGSMVSVSSMGGVILTENFNKTAYPLDSEIDIPSIPRLAQGGAVAQADDILKDKARFIVAGVTIGCGKPSFWSRLITKAQALAAPGMNPVTNQLFKDTKNQGTWSEPPSPYAAQYPYNKVQQTESGHVIELDDTPGAERVHVFHRSGSFIEMHPNGTVVYKNMKDGYLLTMADQYVKVSGKCHIAVDGDVSLYAKGKVDVQADNDVNINTKKDFNVYASNINLRAKKTSKLDGMKIDLRYVTLPGVPVIVPMGAGVCPRLNIGAFKADFPGVDIEGAIAASAKLPLDPKQAAKMPTLKMTAPELPTVREVPLSNPAAYVKKTPAAINYRARLFDTPEEANKFELYAAHIDLQKTLGDLPSSDPRELGGKTRTATTNVTAPATRPSPTYLSFDNYKGKYSWKGTDKLGNTSFQIKDLVDVALYPDIVSPLPEVPYVNPNAGYSEGNEPTNGGGGGNGEGGDKGDSGGRAGDDDSDRGGRNREER